MLFHIENTDRRKILFHVNNMLTELIKLETIINTPNSTAIKHTSNTHDITNFQTPTSNALTTSDIVHMLPNNTYDMFGKFHGALRRYCTGRDNLTQESKKELAKSLNDLRLSLTEYKTKHEKKREFLVLPFRKLVFVKREITQNKGLCRIFFHLTVFLIFVN